MIKQTIKLDPVIRKTIMSLRVEVAEVIAGMVVEEFDTLLKDAPQRSGNYVANMAIAAGDRAGQKDAGRVFPVSSKKSDWLKRGNMAAITWARRNNAHIVRTLPQHIIRGSGFLPTVTIYNKLDYAHIVEGYTEEQLRDENAGGAHAMTRAAARLQARAGEYVTHNSPQWQYYRARGKS